MWPGSPEWEAQASANSCGAQAIAIGGAGFDQRQRLDRLHRRTRINRPLDVTEAQHRPAIGIDHGDGATMPAFHLRAAHHLDQNGITHR